MTQQITRPQITFIAGFCLGIIGMYVLIPFLQTQEWWPGHTTHDHSTEYHTHADFQIVINDQVLDLSAPEYMSTAEKILAPHVHLHDGDGSVVHYHAEEVTFASFLSSIGITLTDTCLTAASQTVCMSDTEEVALFVNEERYTKPLTTYVSTDLDRVLLYAGTTLTTSPDQYLDLVEDRACIFSGTCPERGIAPSESCGLTCEL